MINGFHRGRAVPTHLREALPNRHAAWQSSKNEARVDHPSSVPVRCHARRPHRADEHWARRQRNGFTRSKHDGCDEQRHEYGREDAMLPAEATPQARLLQRLSPGSIVHDILFRKHFAQRFVVTLRSLAITSLRPFTCSTTDIGSSRASGPSSQSLISIAQY